VWQEGPVGWEDPVMHFSASEDDNHDDTRNPDVGGAEISEEGLGMGRLDSGVMHHADDEG
jgi:hypothetical protein